MRRSHIVAATAAAALAASTALATPGAEAAPRQRVLASGLVSPLSLDVAPDGTAYVTQNFAGLLTKKAPGRPARVVYSSGNGNEVGGVSVRNGRVLFTETAGGMTPTDSWLKRLTRNGKARTVANIRAFENRRNPDGRVTYGVRGISPGCASQWPTDQLGPATYTGIPDSHPYATYQTARRTYVADAGMNAIIAVRNSGRIRTVAVLPAVPVPITAEMAQQAGVPNCAVGMTYYGEPVPTDVEMAPNGTLLVSTEGGGLGETMPLGALYRINPARPMNKRVKRVVGGLFAPVGVAVRPNGTVFVSELFGNRIARIPAGTRRVRTFADVNLPGAIDWSSRRLYATTDVLVGLEPGAAPGGKLVRFRR